MIYCCESYLSLTGNPYLVGRPGGADERPSFDTTPDERLDFLSGESVVRHLESIAKHPG